MTTVLTSPKGELKIGPDFPTVLINDQMVYMDQKSEMFQQFNNGNFDLVVELVRRGQASGMDMVDTLINHLEIDEVEWMPHLAARIIKEVECPISLDTRNPQALEASLQAISPYKALINSVTAELDTLDIILPLARKYGAAVIGMPIGHIHGMPKTVGGRLEEAKVILEAADGIGIPRENVILDGICLAASVEPGSFEVTMETIKRFHEDLNVTTILGVSNAGFGMPDATMIDLPYLLAGISWGLDAAIVNPNTHSIVETVRAADFLVGKDPVGRRYIQNYRSIKKKANQSP
jgi:5-methyltetrahydrofolate--homocysteine methyltransferase